MNFRISYPPFIIFETKLVYCAGHESFLSQNLRDFDVWFNTQALYRNLQVTFQKCFEVVN